MKVNNAIFWGMKMLMGLKQLIIGLVLCVFEHEANLCVL